MKGGTRRHLRDGVYKEGQIYQIDAFKFIFSKDLSNNIDLDRFFPDFINDVNFFMQPIAMDNIDVLNKIRETSKRYEYLISLQRGQFTVAYPGDIIYYKPNWKYAFGHIETVTGTCNIPKGNSKTELHIFRDHPSEEGFSEFSMVVDKSSFDDSLQRIHYIGPMSSLIRATAALLTKLFIERKAIDYGGICTLLISQCAEMEKDDRQKRLERLHKAFDNLFSAKKTIAVCSGFSILVYQLAFYIHENPVYLDKALPYKAEACRPSHIYNNLSKNPLWEVKPFNKIIKPFSRDYGGYAQTLLSSKLEIEKKQEASSELNNIANRFAMQEIPPAA